jgi:oligopeptidase B
VSLRLSVLLSAHLIGALLVCAIAPIHAAPMAPAPDALAEPVSSGGGAPAVPPSVAKRPFMVTSPNGAREDDYYWLRDDARTSTEVLAVLKAENDYTAAILAPTQALQDSLYAELVGRLKQDDGSVPVLDHGWWYYTRFESAQQYPIFARRHGSMSAPEQIMLDGNAMAAGKEFFQIGEWSVSVDGHLIAYAEDDVGRRQYVIHIKNLDTGEILSETIANVEPNLVWASDNRTLLYVEKDPITLLSVRVHKHLLGSDPHSDPVVYEEPDHTYNVQLEKSKSEDYLFIESSSTLQSEWRYARATDPELRFRVALAREAGHEYQMDHNGRDFVVRTNWHATNFRLMTVPVGRIGDRRAWHEILPARKDVFLSSFEAFSGYVATNERSGGLMKVHVTSWDRKKDFMIRASEPAYTMRLIATPGADSTTLRYSYTSLTTPPSTFEEEMGSRARTLLKTEPVLGGFDANNYTTEYRHARASDGTLVPVSIAYRKGLKRDGSAPLYQYGYGSYGISSEPAFRKDTVSLLDRGFVVAIAHVRGGQELGRLWYEHGKLLKKRNTFTDFVAVTNYLVAQKYAAADKVFAMGGSAGGLLMGAIANIAPQSYRGIIAHVPFVDVVTTMLDDSIPLTTNEYDEWGDPRKKV